VILKFTGKKEKKDTFIITGICDSGKTSLFLKVYIFLNIYILIYLYSIMK